MVDTHALRVDLSNAGQARAWDGDEGEFWAAQAAAFDESVAGYHRRFLDAAAIESTARVLDIGSGIGQTTRDAARLASAGSALGVDLSGRMIEVARREAEREGVGNARFEQADAQIHPFPESAFDVAISRTGAMFFGDPVAAFANIARALRPGGRLVLLVWQPAHRNEWIREFFTALAAGRDLPAPAPDAPGPFALADPDRVRHILGSAGFAQPRLEGLTEPMCFGRDPDSAYQLVADLLAWMVRDLDGDGRAGALRSLRTSIEAHATPRGVLYGSAAWLVTATRGR